MEFYFASCDDGILLLCRSGASVLRRREILLRCHKNLSYVHIAATYNFSRVHLMAARNSISLRCSGISVLRRRGLFKFDAACGMPERPFKFWAVCCAQVLRTATAPFKISLLNFKRRNIGFEILLLNFSPRTSRLNLKRRSRKNFMVYVQNLIA